MKKISIDKIENGMILARDITGNTGNILLGKGTLLNTTIGRRLKHWGISFVYIEGETEATTETTKEKENKENFIQKLTEKFSNVVTNPKMRIIFDAIAEFKSEN